MQWVKFVNSVRMCRLVSRFVAAENKMTERCQIGNLKFAVTVGG